MKCGNILRESLQHDGIAALLLYPEVKHSVIVNENPDIPSTGSGIFWNFFDWIEKSAFEVSADAFNTFRVGV